MLPNKSEAWLRWVVRGGSGRKVCPGSSAETRRDQLGWRGWIRPFIEPNERAPAGAWMRVGPSAPHRRAQTSDLENYPGSTSGQLSQQQDEVCMVTSRFNQCLAASHTEQISISALKEVRVKSASRDTALFLKGGGALPRIVLCENIQQLSPFLGGERCCPLGFSTWENMCDIHKKFEALLDLRLNLQSFEIHLITRLLMRFP